MKDIVDFKEENKTKLNKKKLIIAISVGIILLVIAITMIIYSSNREARKFLDKYLFRKNISQEKLTSIELNYDSNINVFAYNKNICILAENKLLQYNSSGKLENETPLAINNPVYSVNDKYIAISEKNGTELNLMSGSSILWTKQVDGQIDRISVNDNGYVSVIVTGTTYKSVIVTYDKEGKELFKTYLATTIVNDTCISQDNKYLAFSEINTKGTTIGSKIKIISIEKAKEKENTDDSIINTFESDSDKLILNIEYHNNKLICMYDNEITMINDNTNNSLFSINEKGKNINFANINLDNYIYRATEENAGLFNSNTILEIKNTSNEKIVEYTVEGVAKDIYSYKDIIAVSLGQEIEFVNTNGWLIKRYYSEQEVQNVVVGNGIAGIVYNDKVEIINL